MSKIVNCTPHALVFLNAEGQVIRTLEPSGIIPRVSTSSSVLGEIDGIPEETTVYGEITGLPAPAEDTIYVVSNLVAQACPERQDLRTPGQQIRDMAGRVIGCRSLAKVPARYGDTEAKARLQKALEATPSVLDMETAQWMAVMFEDAQEAILGKVLKSFWTQD